MAAPSAARPSPRRLPRRARSGVALRQASSAVRGYIDPGFATADVRYPDVEPTCRSEDLPKGCLAPVREVAGPAELRFTPTLSVSFLHAEGQHPTGSDSRAEPSEHMAKIEASEMEQYGIGENTVPRSSEVVVADIEPVGLMVVGPQHLYEGGRGIGPNYLQSSLFEKLRVPPGGATDLENGSPGNSGSELIPGNSDDRGAGACTLDDTTRQPARKYSVSGHRRQPLQRRGRANPPSTASARLLGIDPTR